MMTLPQKGLKAKDLDKEMLPFKIVLEEYAKYGQVYDRSVHDRAYDWFYSQVNGNERTRNQSIEQRVDSLYRVKDSKGEWLVYYLLLVGRNWKGNRVDFFHTEGKIEGFPIWHREINPETDEIVSGTTQIEETKTIYTIPFSKEKVNELEPFLSETCSFIIKDRSGRRYTCNNRDEFTNLEYDELIALKTDYLHTDWYKQKQLLTAQGVGR